jgi:hypothetical protein
LRPQRPLRVERSYGEQEREDRELERHWLRTHGAEGEE